jgi:hypothetical protein
MAEVLFFGGNQSASLIAGANITLSSSGNSITIIGATNSGATTFLAGVSTQGNTAGTTGLVNNQILLVGGQNITLSQSANGQSATVSFIGLTESQSFGMSNIGNTSGTSGIASGANVRFLLAGGNNVTLSQSINGASGTITISAFDQTTGAQSIGMLSDGNTAGTSGYASGHLLDYVFVGTDNITLSQSVDGVSGTLSFFGQTVEAYASKSASYTLTPTDYLINGTTGSFTVTLPTAVGITGKIFVVKNSGAGTMTVQGTGGETIDGIASQLVGAGSALTVMSDGANWIII